MRPRSPTASSSCATARSSTTPRRPRPTRWSSSCERPTDMLKIALKGLWARKLRTVLTGFAVVLGVAFVAGTFVFTDTIDASFKDLFERAQKGVDVTVTAKVAVEEDFAAPPTMPSSALDRVKSVDGVDAAQGN